MARLKREELARLQDIAKHLFISDNSITQKEIAEKVGVTEKTIGDWIQKHNWGSLRKSLLTTKTSQIALMYNQMEVLNNEIAERESKYATSKETDILIKLSTTIKNLETEAGVGELVQMGRELVKYVAQTDYELSKTFTKVFDEFINFKMK